MPQTWLIVGASRGIGLEFVTQLLALGHIVIATARAPPPSSTAIPPSTSASKLWPLTGGPGGHNLTILECDVSDEESIKSFAKELGKLGRKGGVLERGIIDVVVVNAGVLVYPNRISEITFSSFAHHIHTNTIGPLLTAQHLLSLSSLSPSPSLSSCQNPNSPLSPIFMPQTPIQIHTLVFISSDSGSTTNFRSFEDGFGAYAASKAALNQGLRHLAAELYRKYHPNPNSSSSPYPSQGKAPVVLALHPGEVTTDMASNVSLDWDVEGIITPQESIGCMLKVIEEKGWGGVDEGGGVSGVDEGRRVEEGEASFWTWEGRRYPW